MREQKFNVGDRVIDKNFSGQVLIVKRVYQDVIDDVVDVYREGDDSTIVKYFSKNLEPVSDHMTADEIAEMFTEASEQKKKEHDDLSVEDKQVDEAIDALKATGYVADESILMDEDTQRLIEKVEEKANNPIHHWYDNREYDAYLRGWKIGRNEGYEEGYAFGLKVSRKAIDDILEQLCTKQS